MNSDEKQSTNAPEATPAPQESLKETDASKVTPLTKESVSPKQNTIGVYVLQWLAYGFWGWTIATAIVLAGIILGFMMVGSPISARSLEVAPIAYSIAAILVLLPVSIICDFLYSKQEPVDKKGAGAVIAVIYAVIFALSAVGSLIAVAFSIVSMVLSGGLEASVVTLITSCFAFVLFLLALVRTIRPFMMPKERLIFRIVMSVIVIGICIGGIFGPAVASARTKDDRALSIALSDVNSEINSYVNRNGRLPSNIDVVSKELPSGIKDTKNLIARNLLTYTPNTKPVSGAEKQFPGTEPSKVFYYELCAEFKNDARISGYESRGYYSYDADEDGYDTFISSGNHIAGKNCYKLKTSGPSKYKYNE